MSRPARSGHQGPASLRRCGALAVPGRGFPWGPALTLRTPPADCAHAASAEHSPRRHSTGPPLTLRAVPPDCAHAASGDTRPGTPSAWQPGSLRSWSLVRGTASSPAPMCPVHVVRGWCERVGVVRVPFVVPVNELATIDVGPICHDTITAESSSTMPSVATSAWQRWRLMGMVIALLSPHSGVGGSQGGTTSPWRVAGRQRLPASHDGLARSAVPASRESERSGDVLLAGCLRRACIRRTFEV